MKITLDRVALKALIDADPEFELELKRNVIAEVGRSFFEKDAKRVIAAAEPELFAQALKGLQDDEDLSGFVHRALTASLTARSDDYYRRLKIAPDVRKLIDDAVAEAKQRIVYDAASQISKAYGDAIQKAVDEKLSASDMDERIEKQVNRLVDQEIERRAQEKFEARMKDIRGMLS